MSRGVPITDLTPQPLSRTADTITFSRADWEAHLDRLEDAIDRASIAAERAERQRLGDAEYRRLCTTLDEADRITSGTSALAW